MFHLIDVTKGMNREMLENFIKGFDYTNLEVVALIREDVNTLVYGRFWCDRNIGVDAFRITSKSKLFERLSRIVGRKDEPSYILISSKISEYISVAHHTIQLFSYEERELIPLSERELFTIEDG